MKAKVMNIFANQTVTNVINNKYVRKFASQMSNHKKLLPIIMLESTVIAGRSYQAYKRGGMTECRERLIDESITAIVWFGVIKFMNKALDKLIACKGIFNKNGLPEITIDLGKDNIRNPIKRAIDKRPEIKNIVGGLKLTKVALAILAGVYISGMILPKFYQNLTRKILHREKFEKKRKRISPKIEMQDFLSNTSKSKSKNKIAFGNLSNNVNMAAHILEHHPIANLLSIDVGLLAGRLYNSRNNDERMEFLFRDVCSSFFYMASTPLVYTFLSKFLDKFKGKNTNLDPIAANYVTKYINAIIKDKNYSVDEFRQAFLGENNSIRVNKVLEKVRKETITLKKFRKIIQEIEPDKEKAQAILKNAKRFIQLRPDGASKELLTIGEMITSVQNGIANRAAFLTKAAKVSTKGVSQNPNKFIAFSEVDKIKTNVTKYIESIIDYAKSRGQNVITSDILTQVKNRNAIMKSTYTVIGMAVSALFLSTIIPKIQYKMTEMRTGNKKFPGIRDIK